MPLRTAVEAIRAAARPGLPDAHSRDGRHLRHHVLTVPTPPAAQLRAQSSPSVIVRRVEALFTSVIRPLIVVPIDHVAVSEAVLRWRKRRRVLENPPRSGRPMRFGRGQMA